MIGACKLIMGRAYRKPIGLIWQNPKTLLSKMDLFRPHPPKSSYNLSIFTKKVVCVEKVHFGQKLLLVVFGFGHICIHPGR